MAHRINETKAQIDRTRAQVERKRNERAAMGEFVSETGETIIDEEEFALIKRLQELKSRYRDDFDRWRELKAEIVYCQNLVEQCRQRLVQEFDSWYNETYLNASSTTTTTNTTALAGKQHHIEPNKLDPNSFNQYVHENINKNYRNPPNGKYLLNFFF